jgi:hypothetical protein
VTDTHTASNEERRTRERKVWRTAFAASVVFHVLLVLFWQSEALMISPFAAAGPRTGDMLAAGGSMEAMQIRTPPPMPIIPPEVPLPEINPPDPVDFEPEIEVEHDIVADEIGTAQDSEGATEGPGREDGEGGGDGGTAAEGLYRMSPPSPRGMIMPPSNRSLRGREVEVWVFVDERGRVDPDSTRLRPPTADGDFNRRLIREAAQWVFEPARRGGTAVAAWFPYTISM